MAFSQFASGNRIPSPAPAAGIGSLPAGVLRALRAAHENRSDMDSNVSLAKPLPSTIFADTLAEEYEKWFLTLHAGIMPPRPVSISVLKRGLRVFDLVGWGSAFITYWSTTIWVPTGVYTGGITTNANAQGLALQAEIDSILSSEFVSSKQRTMEEFADRIARVLYTYTTGLMVQATLSIPPNVKTEMVM